MASTEPTKIRGKLRVAVGVACGALAACGLTDSDEGQSASGGTSATSGGIGGRGGGGSGTTSGGAPSAGRGGNSSGGRGPATGGAPSTQGGEPGEAGATGEPSAGSGGSSGGAPANTGGVANPTGGRVSSTGGSAGSGGAAGDGAGAPSGTGGEDPGAAGAAGAGSLIPVGKAGFAACGSIECPLREFDLACCWNHDTNSSECDSAEDRCTFGKPVHVLHCDETADCPRSPSDEPTGCTFDWRNGGGRAECSSPLTAPELEPTLVVVQLCNPDDPEDDCGSGSCQPVTDQALLRDLLPANFHACY